MMRMLRQEDASRMPERLHIERPFGIHGAPHLSALEPYIEFSIGIRNSSVFSVRVEREIEGRLRMDDQELGRAIQIEYYDPTPIHHGEHRSLIFRQWLSSEAAHKILRQSRTSFNAGWLAVHTEYTHNAILRYERISLGNQTVLENRLPEVWQPLTERQRAEIVRSVHMIKSKPASVLVLWDKDALQFAFEINTVLCSAGWAARVEPRDQRFPEAHNNSIDVYGKDGEMIAHDFSGFLFVIFGGDAKGIGSKLTLGADSKDDLVILIGSKQ